jgi:hypothetical protein
MKPGILFLFAIFIVYSSCNHNVKSPLIGKKIFFSDSLISFNEGNLKPFELDTKGFILIISLSGECPACFKSINEWGRITDSFDNDFNIETYFIMDIKDTLDFKKLIYPNIPKHKNYLLNVDYHFQRKNNLMVPEIRFHGLLLDKRNVIVHDSNILFDGTDMKNYHNQISEIVRQEKEGFID